MAEFKLVAADLLVNLLMLTFTQTLDIGVPPSWCRSVSSIRSTKLEVKLILEKTKALRLPFSPDCMQPYRKQGTIYGLRIAVAVPEARLVS